MDFKNITFAVIAFITFNSCQKIEPQPPIPLVMREQPSPVIAADTIFNGIPCSTGAILKLDNSNYKSLSFRKITYTSDYTKYRFDDNGGGNYIEIFIKPQKSKPKKFTIVPYLATFGFNNYHEAMLLIYLSGNGTMFQGKSGKLHYQDDNNMGFCGNKITNNYNNKTFTFDYSY